MERMSDPLYTNDLKRKVVELDSRIKTLHKEQKAL
jgi:hypothetical protein